jgi:predicted ATPase
MKHIVLTGGPCSGKTVVAAALASAMPHVAVVAEAATQIYSADGSRWDLLDLETKRDYQRRIYQLQIRQEEQAARNNPDKVLLMDRGTIDGAAYWPEGSDAYWPEMGTTREAELARYDLVILMQTAAAIGLYDLESNACRFENPAEAMASTKLLERLWSGHRNLIAVPAYPTLGEKIAAVKQIIEQV